VLTKNIIIVLATTSKFLLINENATWKACDQNGQKRTKAKTRKTIKKCKNDKDDDTSTSLEDNDTNTSRANSKNNKNAPPEVQQHSSSSESDSSRKEDDDSNDEPESLESPNKKPEHISVSAKPHGKKNLTMLYQKIDDNNMDNYRMFIDDAPINNLPGNLKPFIKNVIDTKLFSTVKFISCPADAKNLIGLVFLK